MLRTYAPSETLDPTGRTRSVCGTGGGGLQMDRPQRVGPLLRSARTRGRKDHHQQQLLERNELARQPGNGRRNECAEACGAGTRLQPVFDYLAFRRSNFLRRRTHWRASGTGTRPQAGPKHHLAPERQRTRGPDLDSIHSSAPGSGRLCDRRDHHGSKNRLISKYRERQLFRSTTFRIVAATQVAAPGAQKIALALPTRLHKGWLPLVGMPGTALGR